MSPLPTCFGLFADPEDQIDVARATIMLEEAPPAGRKSALYGCHGTGTMADCTFNLL
jgi:hypothetical protein